MKLHASHCVAQARREEDISAEVDGRTFITDSNATDQNGAIRAVKESLTACNGSAEQLVTVW